MKVRFVVLEPESKRGSYEVPLPIIVGRGNKARFRIQQDRISRKHCELFDRDGDVFLRDLGSTNGTFLDGEQVAASVRTAVAPGSVLRVGTVEIRIDYAGTGRLVRTAPPEEEVATVGFTPLEEDAPAAAEAADDDEPQQNPFAFAPAEAAEESEAVEPFAPAEAAAEDGAAAGDADEPVEEAVAEAAEEAESAEATEEAPAAEAESAAFPEPENPPEPGGFGDLEVEQPQEEAFSGEGFGEPPPAADGSFDFLGGQSDAAPADDEQLGDFFKGLK